jgi:competence protein ComEA
MIHRLIASLASLLAASAFASVDLNRASQAELETVKGIGPAVSTRILGERKNGSFKSWDDFVARVKGVGEGSAATFSQGGLTVDGKAYATASAAAKTAKSPAKERAAGPARATKTAAPAASAPLSK